MLGVLIIALVYLLLDKRKKRTSFEISAQAFQASDAAFAKGKRNHHAQAMHSHFEAMNDGKYSSLHAALALVHKDMLQGNKVIGMEMLGKIELQIKD